MAAGRRKQGGEQQITRREIKSPWDKEKCVTPNLPIPLYKTVKISLLTSLPGSPYLKTDGGKALGLQGKLG